MSVFLLRLALRNLARNLRRSVITGTAVSFGLVMLIFSSALTDGMTNAAVRDGVGGMAGHVVIQAPGWQTQREAELVVRDAPAVDRRLQEALPEAFIVNRVFFEGLLTSPLAATGVGLTAVEPEREVQVNPLPDRLIAGSYLDSKPDGIFVGRVLAESLDVGLGSKVVLVVQGPTEIESRLFRVRGIFETGVDDIDGFYAHVPLSAAQDMLGLGDGVTQVSAHLPSARGTRAATRQVRAAFAGDPVEVLSWPEALPEVADYVRKEQIDLWVFYPVIWLMVALGILNTVLMSVLERTREFGVLLAIGWTHLQVATLVVLEAALLGATASAAGCVVGLAVLWGPSIHGLDLSSTTGGGAIELAGLATEFVVYPAWNAGKVALFGLGATLITVLSGLWPAWTVTRLSPVEALHAP